MSEQLPELRRSVDKLASRASAISDSLERIDRTQRAAAKTTREPFDVSMLTESEIDELRKLIDNSGDVLAYSSSRIADGAEMVAGMYLEFSDLGLVFTDNGGNVAMVCPKAHWAVEKHDQLAAQTRAEEHRRNHHDWAMAAIAAASGIVGAIVGGLLPALLSAAGAQALA